MCEEIETKAIVIKVTETKTKFVSYLVFRNV